ncbi:hypothetical protein ASPVEDRAFT_651057 [Aspergillus versicolor CBS 583.65]|uniref:ABM domain-containing protein n=1 Tax=Aspergillus versicolor CBS 583.65 TaxID=1036611 RepID=A0A1L9PJR4_ASPVE|nr:uncharacterized protein ASPVEDRAFT_651057 [Aspergillus versicolor CBS 583.65]OJJ01769.1 hypothetical protein ASPVEDRAFT_651057 [Aspergillus versicolor CBS 583.65]
MATAEQMAAYAAYLRSHTVAHNKPVTEICIFQLQPQFWHDHSTALAKFESQIVANTAPGGNKPNAQGIRKIAYGFSVDDAGAFVWMLDWEKIQDHWDFWQTAAFPPVMNAITELFVAGRPLVRHYDFGEAGMLDREFEVARVLVWDDGEVKPLGNVTSCVNARQTREGYAVDVNETTWWCSLLGYESEADCRADELNVRCGPAAEKHIVRLQYI